MKVLLADDHDLVRDTLAAYLMREPAIEVSTAEDFSGVSRRLRSDGQFDLSAVTSDIQLDRHQCQAPGLGLLYQFAYLLFVKEQLAHARGLMVPAVSQIVLRDVDAIGCQRSDEKLLGRVIITLPGMSTLNTLAFRPFGYVG